VVLRGVAVRLSNLLFFAFIGYSIPEHLVSHFLIKIAISPFAFFISGNGGYVLGAYTFSEKNLRG